MPALTKLRIITQIFPIQFILNFFPLSERLDLVKHFFIYVFCAVMRTTHSLWKSSFCAQNSGKNVRDCTFLCTFWSQVELAPGSSPSTPCILLCLEKHRRKMDIFYGGSLRKTLTTFQTMCAMCITQSRYPRART